MNSAHDISESGYGCAGPEWLRSSYSGNEGGNCVEVAAAPGLVQVRDSKDVSGPALAFAPATWSAFIAFAFVSA